MNQPNSELNEVDAGKRHASKALQLRVAACLGFLGVALGAFGAHGLKDRLEAFDRIETWETAVFYHLIHAGVLAGLAMLPGRTQGLFWMFTGGIALFSGSLYLLALTNLTPLGAITPVGGVMFLAAWWIMASKAHEILKE